MKAPGFFAATRVAPRYVPNFDSASAMVRALARLLKDKDVPPLGLVPPLEPVAALVNALPRRWRETLYVWSGWNEAVRPDDLDRVDAEDVSHWVTSSYPKRAYPAVMIGSSSGAMMHLAAALRIPWLPQTFLIPVRQRDVEVDEPRDAMEKARAPAEKLLEANPELKLHHMFDPNQDRLMLHKMTYFRVKRLTLGKTYEQFIAQNLEPGGTILVSECRRTWPTTEVDERHVFQFGALGGATPEEFLHGSPRVEAYLQRYDAHVRRWDAPEPDGERPEAEWGFEPALGADVERFAAQHGYEVRRIGFEEPEHPSPFVADLHRWWYRERNMVSNRLLVESFVHMEPHWALRTGSVPFWMKFNMEPSLEWLEQYLDQSDPYDEIYLMLFQHGVDAVGLPTIDQWRSVLARAREHGDFVGVDEELYPLDFGNIIRQYTHVRKIPARYPLPGPLPLSAVERFLRGATRSYPVEWPDADADAAVTRETEAGALG